MSINRMGVPLTHFPTGEVRVQLPALHPAQQHVLATARRFNVVCCGRRWGKTTLGIERLLVAALVGQPVAWLAPTYRMLAEVWQQITTRVQPVVRRSVRQEYRIELVTGGRIELWSMEHPDRLRGRWYARVVLDEAAMLRDAAQVWAQVVRPTLTDRAGDAWLLSTPRGHNFFWQCYQRGQQHDGEWQSWQMPTRSNPYIAAAELAAAQRELPAHSFAQEYEAQFVDDAGGVFRGVLAAVGASPQDTAEPGHSYVIGVDWGRQQDATCCAVLDTREHALVALERWQQRDYGEQLARLRELAHRFQPDVILAEQNGVGLPLIEQLQRAGDLPVQPFVTSNASKSMLIERLALALEQGMLRLLDDPVLLDELQQFTMERLPSGLVRYAAPAGLHDDCVMALALAWHAASDHHAPLVLW